MDRHKIILALGSNHEAHDNIPRAIRLLGRGMAEMTVSTPLRNPAIGISAPDFTNCVVSAVTTMDYPSLCSFTKEIETMMGRNHGKGSLQIIIDIDIMQYDCQRYHESDWQRPYVSDGLKEIKDLKELNEQSTQHNTSY